MKKMSIFKRLRELKNDLKVSEEMLDKAVHDNGETEIMDLLKSDVSFTKEMIRDARRELIGNGIFIVCVVGVVGAGAYVVHRVISRNELIKKEEKIDSEIHDIGQKIADLNDKIDGAAVSTQEIHEELVKEVDLSQQAVAATEQAAAEEKAFEEMAVDAEEKRTEKLGQFEERLFKKRAGMLNKNKKKA